jgi:hypothetical protein
MANNTDLDLYFSKVRGSESGGKANAKNPYSSASGLYQFTRSTWEGLGYDWDDRFNPSLQQEAATKFTKNNINYLRKNLGIEPTHADLYGAHFLGAVGYKNLYKTADSRPISDVMSPLALSQNKGLVYNKDGSLKTVGDIKNWLNKKMKAKVSTKSTSPKVGGAQQEAVASKETPEKDYYLDGTIELQGDTGEYATAPEYYEEKGSKEDIEGDSAKEELRQAQQEKNFLEDFTNLQKQVPQEQAYSPQQSGYELYMPELPEYQTQQAPSYF